MGICFHKVSYWHAGDQTHCIAARWVMKPLDKEKPVWTFLNSCHLSETKGLLPTKDGCQICISVFQPSVAASSRPAPQEPDDASPRCLFLPLVFLACLVSFWHIGRCGAAKKPTAQPSLGQSCRFSPCVCAKPNVSRHIVADTVLCQLRDQIVNPGASVFASSIKGLPSSVMNWKILSDVLLFLILHRLKEIKS